MQIYSHSEQNDSRLTLLKTWLEAVKSPKLNAETLRPASSDASFRRYFRLDGQGGKTYIAMDAPPPQEDTRPFIKVARLFGGADVSVPKVLEKDEKQGFLLLTDLGVKTYLQELRPETAHQLYLDAIDALIRIQNASEFDVLAEYDREKLQNELNLFPQWYIKEHIKKELTENQKNDLKRTFELILANNLAQPQVYVHRDYHSRNLMVLEEGNPGILDFQDAVYGPITYDLVSLLRDAYIKWDEEMVLDLMIRYWERARKAGLPIHSDIDSFYRDFEWMGLQRHIKVLGIFARLNYRDGKSNYLNDLPLVMEYARKVAQRYKELRPLLNLFDELEDKKAEVGYTF